MPRGDKDAYTDKQKRKAEHIEESEKKAGKSASQAERIAWAPVNKQDGGGKKSGSGRGRASDNAPARKGGRKGGRARSRKTGSRGFSAPASPRWRTSRSLRRGTTR